MIDEKARQQLRDRQMMKQFQSGINGVAEKITGETSNVRLVAKDLKDIQDTMANEALKKLDTISNSIQSNLSGLDEKIKSFENVQKKVPKPFEVKFPDSLPMKGKFDVGKIDNLPSVDVKSMRNVEPLTVDRVNKMPPVEVSNLGDLSKSFSVSFKELRADMLNLMKVLKVDIPTAFDIKSPVKIQSWGDLIDGIEELKKGFNLLINKEGTEYSSSNPMPVAITSYPPVMVPQPVTHISINALNGFVKTTAATVGTSLAILPSYGVLSSRRSIIIYNNSSNTIYIGGSDVTTSNGMPVPANSYSPILDAGASLIVYGIAATAGNNVRVMEISDENSGR